LQPDELPIRSYSQLSQYEECGEQYRLKRIERRDELPAVWFPAGNTFHGITEAFDRFVLEHGIEVAVHEDWAGDWPMVFGLYVEEEHEKTPDIPVEEWRTAGRTKEDIPWWNEHGPEMVRSYVDWRVKNADRLGIWVAPDGTPGIEWEGTASIGGVRVTAKADRVFVDRNTGATIIVDLKSGSYEPDDPLQLRIYRMVIERATAEPMWYGAFYMARKAEMTKPFVLDTTNEQAIAQRFQRMELGISAGVFTPRPSKRNCAQCGFKRHCIFVEE
jgi:putative RecB family exonuclease